MALEWLYGLKVTQDAGDIVTFGTFVISATDVEDIRAALGDDSQEESRAVLYRGDRDFGMHPILDLTSTADGDLDRLMVSGPGGEFVFGSAKQAMLTSGAPGAGTRRVIEVVTKSGRHRMGRSRLLVWLEVGVALALTAAWLLHTLRAGDPLLSVLTAAGLAGACGWAHNWRRRYCAARGLSRFSGFVTVDPTQVSALRAQRWNRRRDFLVGVWTFLGTAAAAVVTVWLAQGS